MFTLKWIGKIITENAQDNTVYIYNRDEVDYEDNEHEFNPDNDDNNNNDCCEDDHADSHVDAD